MKQTAQEQVEDKAPPPQDLTTLGDLTLTTETINGLANISEPMFSLSLYKNGLQSNSQNNFPPAAYLQIGIIYAKRSKLSF